MKKLNFLTHGGGLEKPISKKNENEMCMPGPAARLPAQRPSQFACATSQPGKARRLAKAAAGDHTGLLATVVHQADSVVVELPGPVRHGRMLVRYNMSHMHP